MDPFQGASAAIGLAGEILALILYLRKVQKALGTIQDDINDLIRDLENLDRLYGHLEQRYNQHPHEGTSNVEHHELWLLLRQTLQDGGIVIRKLGKEIERVYGGDPSVQGWLDKFKKQQRLRSSAPKLDGIGHQIQAYNSILQLWLSRISLAYQDDTRNFERDASAQLEGLHDGIQSIHERIEESEHTWFTRDNAFDAIAYQTFTRASITALDKPQQQRRFVVHGVGGSGKTQFCCKFAQDHQQRFWGVFWIDGRSHDQLKQTLSQNVAKIGGVDANHKAALNWLSNQEERWLLIIDNADDPNIELNEYFPKGGRGHVLITTRNPGYQQLGNVEPRYFKFDGMRDDEASILLLRTAGFPSQSEDVAPFATRIVETLGYLALAITVAGSAIREGFCRLQSYLQYFEDGWEERRAQIQNSETPLDEFDQRRDTRVEATFDISYRAIAKKGTRSSRDALQLLKMFAFLHCENVRYDFLNKCVENVEVEDRQQSAEQEAASISRKNSAPKTWSQWTFDLWIRILTALDSNRSSGVLPDVLRDGRQKRVLDERRIRKAMKELTQYSLAIYNSKTDSWSMHPLVHRWAQEMLGMKVGEQYLWCEAAATLLCNCVYLGQEDEELLRQLLPHVDAVRKEQAMIEKRIKDKRMARIKPWPVFESSFSPQRAFMLVKFSIVYAQNGRWEDAESLQRVVQAFTTQVLGFAHVKTRRITMALAGTLWHLGRSDDSAQLLEQLVEACNKFCGSNHRETLVTQQKLGESRFLQGRVADAKALYRLSLAGLERLYGPTDEDTLMVMDSLGGALILSGTEGAFAEAQRLHQTTFETRKRLYGAAHLKTLASRELVCTDATWKGSRQEMLDAEIGMTEIVEIRKEKLGREHAYTLLGMLYLARVKIDLDKLKEAEELFDFMLPTAERNHGKNHMAVLFGRFHMGRMRARQGRWAEARDILVDVTERQKVCLQGWGRFHYDRVGALRVLAEVHNALGEHDECDAVVAETLLGFERITTMVHPWAVKLRADLAEWKRQRSQPAPP
ncbi:hypothetical protein LTR85_000746 [Meristemomyces frigidus]|nr:hypothetical protein LTR85_000746 [Meristemomyces frigidus]